MTMSNIVNVDFFFSVALRLVDYFKMSHSKGPFCLFLCFWLCFFV